MSFEAAWTEVIPVAWGDMDAYGHVNNTVFLRWFETARIEWLERVRFPDDDKRGPVLANSLVNYRRQVKWPDTVTVSVGVLRIGTSKVVLGYQITSKHHRGQVVADGETTVVLCSKETGRGVPLDDELRARIGPASAP